MGLLVFALFIAWCFHRLDVASGQVRRFPSRKESEEERQRLEREWVAAGARESRALESQRRRESQRARHRERLEAGLKRLEGGMDRVAGSLGFSASLALKGS